MTGFESIVASAISGVALPIFQSMWEGGGRFLGVFGNSLSEQSRQLIFQASGQYIQNYTKRHGIVKILGMSEPIPLKEIYTTVQFLGDSELASLDSIENLETAFRKSKQRTFVYRNRRKRPGLEVANKKQFLMVLGGPGTGKSTFLRRVGLEALQGANGEFEHSCIPVFIELKQFRSGSINIKQKIIEEFRICKFPEYEAFTSRALEQGKLLILFDGLDEVPTSRMNEIIQKIQDFVDLYNQNRFVTSCRVAAYRHNFRRFTDVAMAEFDDNQIRIFITNWFRKTPEIAQDCWQKLNQPENSAAKELTQTPLLLTLICLLYKRAGDFPVKRATIYERALRVLLEEWAGEKGISQEKLYKGLDTSLKEALLSEIAYSAFIKDHLFLSRRDVAEQIQIFLKESLPNERFIDGEAVLKSIEVQHGVLVERAEGIYSFSHLTLQEYLTAQYIDDHRQIDGLVTRHLADSRWNEVFLLVAGLMRGGADPLLRKMEQVVNSSIYISTTGLNSLLKWAQRATAHSPSSYSPLINQAAAIAIASAIASASDSDSASDIDITVAIASDIARASSNDSAIARASASAIARARAIAQAQANDIDSASDIDIDIAINIARASANDIAQASARVRTRASTIDVTIASTNAQYIKELGFFEDAPLKKAIARLEALKVKLSRTEINANARPAFFNQFTKVWLAGFQLTPELINIIRRERKALNRYLAATKLIVQCEKEAVRVSPATRTFLRERLLQPLE